ncbi:hypothetical protein D3C85_1548390 [compost metagenome]
MFSGISSRFGYDKNLPDNSLAFQSNQVNLLIALPATEFEIASRDFDFSLTATTSPALNWYEGIFTVSPFTVICLWLTN